MGAAAQLIGTPWANACDRVLSQGLTADSATVCSVGATILKISPPAFPTVIEEMVLKARAARDALGPDLNDPIPVPLDQWEMNGVTCALFEQLTPISSNRLKRSFQLHKTTPLILAWLRGIAAIDRGPSRTINACVRALADCPYEMLRDAASRALAQLEAENFVGRSMVMHGDLWIGNIMLDPSSTRGFMLIDWRGCEVDGYPIFDLVRFADSAKLSPVSLKSELEAHAALLGCEPADTRFYLLAAFGHFWLHLDQFPPERFNAMARRCLEVWDRAIHA
jgi:hypothetical protein